MLIIGERIHIIAPRVRAAVDNRDAKAIQEMALQQVKAGAHVIDLNIGPARRTGIEVMPWIVETAQQVTDVELSLDTTNAAAVEAGLKVCKGRSMINSASAEANRFNAMVPLATQYNTDLIVLTMTEKGIPNEAAGRAEIAIDLLGRISEAGVPTERIYFDPLVLTVTSNQDAVIETVEAIRIFKQLSDPPPKTVVGLSNVSNGAPNENRPLINRVFMVMCMGAGLDAAIADPLDKELLEAVRTVATRDTSTPVKQLMVNLCDAVANMEELDPSLVDMKDPDQVAIYKTVQILQNKILYAHSYLRV
ncbi:MAG: dihydropteroate synthase [Bacteroidetes bacterium]|nr:dihydropteroate synthase [Bacteroidota bacterium]MCL5026525.1 dihydropteroate synthase [Chloroflexota bacterium]